MFLPEGTLALISTPLSFLGVPGLTCTHPQALTVPNMSLKGMTIATTNSCVAGGMHAYPDSRSVDSRRVVSGDRSQ